MKNGFGYRVWQFWQSFNPSPSQEDWDRIKLYLTPEEIRLFSAMPIPDQNHSLRVLESILDKGPANEDLVKAALLHDIGKGLHPLRRWERVFAVLIGGFFPDLALSWGKGESQGLKRSLVVIEQHPVWGAALAEDAGSSEMVVWLIKNHENSLDPGSISEINLGLLEILQAADNLN
jgi:putative nucleotidyltransferase with HDIG domain